MSAGSTEVQQAFLKAVGMISAEPIQIVPVLSPENCTLISCALSHRQIEEEELTSGRRSW